MSNSAYLQMKSFNFSNLFSVNFLSQWTVPLTTMFPRLNFNVILCSSSHSVLTSNQPWVFLIYHLFSQFLSLPSIPVVKTVVLSTVLAHLYRFSSLLTSLAGLRPPLSNALSTQQLQCPLINTNQSGTFLCTKPFNWFPLHLGESPNSKVARMFQGLPISASVLLKVLKSHDPSQSLLLGTILNIYFLEQTTRSFAFIQSLFIIFSVQSSISKSFTSAYCISYSS